MNKFTIRRVENGWFMELHMAMGCVPQEFVFTSLDEMNAWLKAKYEIPSSGAHAAAA